MADISKIKLPGSSTTFEVKDTTARGGLSTLVGTHAVEALKDGAWSEVESTLADDSKLPTGAAVKDYVDTAVEAETTRATGVETSLTTRVNNLEARGRFLSSWNAVTGTASTTPEIPAGAVSPYTYTYKSGDYYIIGTIGTGTLKKPSGSSITATKTGDVWNWTITSEDTTDTLNVGDYYTFDGSAWVHVSNAQQVVSFNMITGQPTDNTNLNTALSAKANTADLGGLAVKDSASGDTAAQTITGVKATGTINAELTGALAETDTNASITAKDAFTPEGTVAVTLTNNTISEITDVGTLPTFTAGTFTANTPTVIDTTKFSGGSKAADTFSEGTLPTKAADTFTAGSLGAATTAKFANKVLKIEQDAVDTEKLVFTYVDSTDTTLSGNFSDAVTAQGTYTAPTFTEGAFSQGTLPSFTEGAFTAAEIQTGFYTAGTAASKTADTFTQGTLPTKADKTVSGTATFTGTEATDLIPKTIQYKKTTVGTLGVSASVEAGGLAVGDITVPTQTITVS